MKSYLLTLITLTLFVGCASSTKKEIEQEKQQFSNIQTREQMITNAKAMLDESKDLTASEKNQLSTLFADVSEKTAKINAEINKSKTVLFQEITTKKYNEKKTAILKSSIKKLYNQKIDIMMDAFKKSREILGMKTAPEHFHRQFLFLDNDTISIE